MTSRGGAAVRTPVGVTENGRVRYGILGTTQALRDDGTVLPVGGARLRALLTVLALRPGRTVPVGVLVDEVWDGEPPADAPAALQALVGRLRRAIGHQAVASAESGYRLAAEPEAVDLFRFERLAGEGARALAEGDPARAMSVLDDALALWRGPALADLPDRYAAAARWTARRLDARRDRLAAALRLGRATEALPELTALCGEHPLDEPLQALRLRALRDAGRTAQALAAYDEVRTLIADRLGTDPGTELTTLYGELLRQEPAPPAPVKPSAPAPLGNLRARLTSFVGRESEMAALRDDLSRGRLVTLLGPGGAGKTRLSQEVADTVDPGTWPDGVWLAELAPVDDPEAVPEAVLAALGARETVLSGAGSGELRAAERASGDERAAGESLARLTEYCSRRRMLLLLDNCEHVIEAAAALADHLLARCPGLTVLATSREPLGVPGEAVRPVDPLPDPTALRLLAERGAAARPGFRVDADEATALAGAEICRRLDGLPLAIELAAARLRMLTPQQIADRLDDRFRLLTSGSRTVLPRQQTLRAVVDWSWELLDDDERVTLRRLSVFAGGCTLEAAEAVCADGSGGAGDAARLLGSLVDKSLVVAAPAEDGQMRYRLLETVGEYAAERLEESGSGTPSNAGTWCSSASWPVRPTRCCAAPDSSPPSGSSSASTRTCAPPCATPSPRATSRRRCAWCCRSPGTGRSATCAATPCTGRTRRRPSAPTRSPRPYGPRPRSTSAAPTRPRPCGRSCWRRRGGRSVSSSWSTWTTRWTSGRTRPAWPGCGRSWRPTGPASRRPAAAPPRSGSTP